MNDNKRLIKNTLLITIGNFGAKMVAFLLLPLYTSLLSTSEYGKYDFIVAISAFLLPLVTFSMHEALFRFIIDEKNNEKAKIELISNSLAFVVFGNGLLGLLLFILYFLIPGYFGFLYIFLYVMANSLFSFASNLLRGIGDTKKFAIISTLKNIAQIVLNIICVAIVRIGISGLLLSFFISEFIAFLVVAYILKIWRYIDFKTISYKNSKELIKYSLPLIPNSIGTQIINISDRLVISWTIGSAPNGVYAVSYKFPNMVDTLYHFFYMAWSESASIVFARGIEKAKDYYRKLYFILDNFVFSFIILMISYMPILYRILIKGNFGDGFKYISILMLAMYFNCIAKFYSGIYTALKKTKIMAISTSIAACINLIINIIFINRYGLYAAAISTLIAEFILLLIRKRGLKDFIDIKENKNRLLIKLILILVVLSLYDYNNIMKIVASTIITTTAFLIYNLKIIKKVLKKFKNKNKIWGI